MVIFVCFAIRAVLAQPIPCAGNERSLPALGEISPYQPPENF